MMAIFIPIITTILLLISDVSYAKTYGSKICQSPEFTCYQIRKGQTWKTLFPDPKQRDLIMRINRMNTRLYPGLKIAVPKSNEIDFLSYSPLPTQISAPGSKVIIISLNQLAFGAYTPDGKLEHWGPISSAKGYCSDIRRGCHTPTGHFTIESKQGAGCYSTKFPVGKGGAPMPYCMFFYKGFALHGSPELPGFNASHGCIRLMTNDAKWLNQEFTVDQKNIPVIIHQ